MSCQAGDGEFAWDFGLPIGAAVLCAKGGGLLYDGASPDLTNSVLQEWCCALQITFQKVSRKQLPSKQRLADCGMYT